MPEKSDALYGGALATEFAPASVGKKPKDYHQKRLEKVWGGEDFVLNPDDLPEIDGDEDLSSLGLNF